MIYTGNFSNGMSTNDSSDKLLSKEGVQKIIDFVINNIETQEPDTFVSVTGWWNGELRWARNRVSLASDRRDISVTVSRTINNANGRATTNQLDEQSLKGAIRAAERAAKHIASREPLIYETKEPELTRLETRIWSDATYRVTADQRSKTAQLLTSEAEENDLLSAGYMEMRAGETAQFANSPYSVDANNIVYHGFTQAQCSMTVRHPKGVGSGWAGLSSFDWSAIDGPKLAAIALDKCIRSLNPVAIEPGRYTVVLEPQPVSELFEPLFEDLGRRLRAEEGKGPFPLGKDNALGIIRTKLGLKIIDERITVTHAPEDPLLGVIPQRGLDDTVWIENGILRHMSYERGYSLSQLNENLPGLARPAYRMSGGNTSMEEMISSTKRGLIVTRFSGVSKLDDRSVLMTGLTRDGLWLIENGTITKAVKNLRFTESPLFVLNQVVDLGVPVPVFRPVNNPYFAALTPAIVPPIKANDFSFTSTIDAI